MVESYGWEATTNDVLRDVDLHGVHALITGGSGGLGLETARALATCGADITITARDAAKAEKAVTHILESAPAAKVDVLELELQSPASIVNGAKLFSSRYQSLDLLINNAGIMACPLSRTEEDWESQLATNHFGHFLLTHYLLPLLKQSSGRIVNLTSAGHRLSDFHFDDPHYLNRPYDRWESYGQSKTANVLFTVALQEKLIESGINCFAVHPGAIFTELGRHVAEQDVTELQARRAGGHARMKSVEQGAATTVWAATATELKDEAAIYLEDCQIAVIQDGPFGTPGVAHYALETEKAQQLWDWSLDILHDYLNS